MKGAAWLEEGKLHSHVIVIGLGGNLGGLDRVQARFDESISTLSALWGQAIVSTSIVTAPVGEVPDQPDFLNAVAAFKPSQLIDPLVALGQLQELEEAQGRTRQEPGGPRTLDLDLLLLGHQRVCQPRLILPHPRMHERAFVLDPLAELFGRLEL